MFTKSLGLSIVNSYVEDKLKGSMQFESTACGTTVSFTFKMKIEDYKGVVLLKQRGLRL